MLTLLLLLGCTQTEASEPPLPPGAEAFRGALQSFQTIRMWMRAPERNGLTGGKLWFGERFIVSFRSDGVAVEDRQGQGSRYRWGPEGVSSDGNVVGQDLPASSLVPDYRLFAGIPGTEHMVAEAIATLRSPQTPWLVKSPGHYGWAAPSNQYAEVTPPSLAAKGCHMFLRFGEYDALRYVIFQCGRREMLPLDVLRIEVNPPLPANWFAADAPEMEMPSRMEFEAGEPLSPLNPDFYAPGATPPLAWRGNLGPGGPPPSGPPPSGPPPGQ